ncbi:YdcF family protein [Luteolibacter arcticus]|uniref:YdcF family protein n=1 Tax=Luteolibacter arcticus TaxID=1581411 RepID=A0ABT3GQN3_9BACT|nr:YdcF family protein [Luteolibacter arcticus]MCW1925773.1 YdcF family protein [Luteolibacter arcticus]
MHPDHLAAALVLWDYHQLHHELIPADGILVFGSNDLRVAGHAAELFHRGLAPWILFSGARGRMTQDWAETEAEAIARVARDCGVPEEVIFIENRATNTGENIRYSRELLASREIVLSTAIVVQKPYMERRTIAALDVQWPEVVFRASSPALGFADYCAGALTPELVTSAMTGDFQRIIDYPALGFASAQEIPAEVMDAFRVLVAAGYTGQLR